VAAPQLSMARIGAITPLFHPATAVCRTQFCIADNDLSKCTVSRAVSEARIIYPVKAIDG